MEFKQNAFSTDTSPEIQIIRNMLKLAEITILINSKNQQILDSAISTLRLSMNRKKKRHHELIEFVGISLFILIYLFPFVCLLILNQ